MKTIAVLALSLLALATPTSSFGFGAQRSGIFRAHDAAPVLLVPSSVVPELCMRNDRNKTKNDRRGFLCQSAFLLALLTVSSPANAVERAVGAAEAKCRQEGNCLELGDWDGAVGWQWGASDRCDPSDPRCGPDGKLRDAPPAGKPVPDLSGQKITNVVEVKLKIGKNEEGILRLGLYGDACPESVAEMMSFLSSDRTSGFSTTSKLLFEEGYGAYSAPVALSRGGQLNVLYPNQRLDFGVPSQAASYARSRNMPKAGEGFTAQPRPSPREADAISKEPFVRKHDVAGLISLPARGLGYGGTGFETEDEAFASAFQITAADMPSMDKEGRRVVGQLVDAESMATLARVGSLPTNKGLKGIVPGQNYGPPLTAVRVQECRVVLGASDAAAAAADSSNTQVASRFN